MNETTSARQLRPWTRRLLLASSGFALIAALQLYVGTEHTDQYFAWTIQPPLTAAFLGANYGAAVVLLFLSSRQRVWTYARIGVIAGLVLTALLLLVTLIHLDRFHLHDNTALTRVGTWAFVGAYALLPPALLAAAVSQALMPGGEPPRLLPLPLWFRGFLGCQAGVLLGVGGALLLAPAATDSLWPWTLTPLTARAIGAWCFSVGFAAALAIWENDWRRIQVNTTSYAVLGALLLLALARYPATIEWTVSGWVFLFFAASMVMVGAYAWHAARAPDLAVSGS